MDGLTLSLELGIALVALTVAVTALIRAYMPPQTKHVMRMTAEFAELQTELEQLSAKVTKRTRIETVEKARGKLQEQRETEASLEAEGLRILAESAARKQPELPLTDKAALRRAAGITH